MLTLKRVQDSVSWLFYQHGLLCATYPFAYIFGVITIVLFMCYPLLNIPLPGNAPLQFITPVDGYTIPPPPAVLENGAAENGKVKGPRWYFGSPVAYIQQIVIKAAILPWNSSRLISADLLRASLSTVFELLDHINNYQLQNNGSGSVSVADVCLRVSEVVSDKKTDGLLPEYNCLSLSPARFWNQDKQQFLADEDLIGTLFKKRGLMLDTQPSIRDILFGVPWVRKYHILRRRRIISYAVTIALRDYNQRFISGLEEKLSTTYRQQSSSSTSDNSKRLVHIHYHGHNYIVEYTPLMFAYVVLCFYLYFSVRKIEMVKSKWGLALSAMVTVFASLIMSVSLCVFFGLTPSLSGSEIFPYLVVIIGLENILVVTKSVVTTPVHLEVKLRIAQGLQKEGWYIFKNLMTELLVLAVGFFTFVPAIQEFCLFAVLGLGSDFFLQMFFFTTVLSIDIRRMELSDLQRPSMHEAFRFENIELKGEGLGHTVHSPVMGRLYPPPIQSGINGGIKPVESLRLESSDSMSKFLSPPPSPVSALEICDDLFYMDMDDERIPRRMRIINFWARYRILQRGIMICVVIWITLIVYKTGLVENMDEIGPSYLTRDLDLLNVNSFHGSSMERQKPGENQTETLTDEAAWRHAPSGVTSTLENVEPWQHLSSNHWLTLMSYYNISLLGRYLTILPSIHLLINVSPDFAVNVRHPSETDVAYLNPPQNLSPWDPSGQFTIEPNQSSSLIQRLVRYPRTKVEFVITILLGIASICLLFFITLSMYKCVCSRNYAKWRASWQRRLRKANKYYKQIRESVPLILNGHIQSVECIVTNGHHIVSSCLGGEIRVWDYTTGECTITINRTRLASRRTPTSRTVQRREHRLSAGDLPTDSSSSPVQLFDLSDAAAKVRLSGSSLGISLGGDDGSAMETQTTRHHSRHRSIDHALASIIPDLTETIDTDFRSVARNRSVEAGGSNAASATETGDHLQASARSKQQTLSNGYDFTHFESYFAEHRKLKEEEERYVLRKRGLKQHRENLEADDPSSKFDRGSEGDRRVQGSSSRDEMPSLVSDEDAYIEVAASIWCLTYDDNLIFAGCGNGALEFWDACTGLLCCIYQHNKSGITGVCLRGNRVIAARNDGSLDFLEYFWTSESKSIQSSAFHRSSLNELDVNSSQRFNEDIVRCCLLASVRAHQQPINFLSATTRLVITASHDHTLKVYRIEDFLCLYTLHGHTAGVTALCLEKQMPLVAVSGSVDTSLRMWDLQSGMCIHKLSGHSSTVTSVICSPEHIASVGMDDRLCIWDRSKGHLIHCVQLEAGYCNTVALLTRHLIITGGQGSLHLWDVHKGTLLRALSLGDLDTSVFVRQLLVVNNFVVVCDYGPQLRVVQFTPVLEKDD